MLIKGNIFSCCHSSHLFYIRLFQQDKSILITSLNGKCSNPVCILRYARAKKGLFKKSSCTLELSSLLQIQEFSCNRQSCCS